MKILIAEDEMLERKAMRKFLETHFPNMAIVGEAINGRMAVEMAKEMRPDILLMDIQMPGMNGLEAIQEIRTVLPGVQLIMITAYDSFHYAKEALQLGAKAYILKPSRKEETIEAIKRVELDIEEERSRLEKQSQTLALAKQLLVSKVVHGATELDELQQRLYPTMTSGYVLAIDSASEQAKAKLTAGVHAWTTDEILVHEQFEYRRVILLCISDEQREKKEAERLKKRVQRECGDAVRIACGQPRSNVKQFACSFYEAISALYAEVEGTTVERSLAAKDWRGKFIVAFQKGDTGRALACRHELHQLGESVDEELYYVMRQLLDQKKIEPPPVAKTELRTEEEWRSYVQQCCERIKNHYQSMNQMERTKIWVQANLDQAITLDKAAAYANLSSAYFSNVFKETTGENFVDYVTGVRMQKAVELLAEQHYSLKEISYMVGYKDPNYFSRVFKKHYQVAPSQYSAYK
ncbi:response regulator [Shouchella shacheensis]|uniref:response regulator n=1 Tax=Shouchella shacheensis TaxID=1649580 RepID=UPI000740556C|nr:response regulator [Shouchella shacheensis]